MSVATTIDTTDADAGTAEFLALCARQLHVATRDSKSSIDELVADMLTINRMTEALKTNADALSPVETADAASSLQKSAMDASMQLQSVDRLHQRLENVRNGLSQLSIVLSAINLKIDDSAWHEFLRDARSNYTMESEREMFDDVFGDGYGGDEESADSDEPELF